MAMMGLRLREGLRRSRVVEETGATLEEWADRTALDRLVEGGFLVIDEERIAATAAGRQRLDSVLTALLI
jgi:coproporphyrinogen III oxidase-like Fe-S oxidoreductase